MRLAGFLLLTLLLAVPLPARAQDDLGPGEPVITSGDVVLFAVDDHEEDEGAPSLCVRLAVAGETVASECGDLEPGRFGAGVFDAHHGGRTFAVGFVPIEGTAAVEVELMGGARVPATVSAGERYRGAQAGKVAFFLAETTGAARGEAAEPMLLRRFDASGALSGAAAVPAFRQMVFALRGPRVALMPGAKRHDRPFVFGATRFAPSPIRLDRTERVICLEFVVLGDELRECAAEGDPAALPLTADVRPGCATVPTVVAGLTRRDAAHVELVLGSGRTFRRATRSLRRLDSTYRAYAVRVPIREAVRTVRAVDASGSTLKTVALRVPPASRGCTRHPFNQRRLGYGLPPDVHQYGPFRPIAPPDVQVAAGGAPGARLLVRDEGEHLCVSVERLAADRRDCRVPHPEVGHLLYPYAPFVSAERTAVGGLAPPGAATIQVEFDGKDVVEVAVVDGGAYTGRYRGHVRFFLAESPGRRRVTRVTARDAQGKPVHDLPLDPSPSGPSRVAVGERYRILARAFDIRFRSPYEPEHVVRYRGRCLGIVSLRETPDLQACELGTRRVAATGRVLCAPSPRVVLAGHVGRRMRGIHLELGDGRVIASRTARIPRAAGGGRVWVVDVPARATVRRLRVLRPRPGAWHTYRVAPAARQCGYDLLAIHPPR